MYVHLYVWTLCGGMYMCVCYFHLYSDGASVVVCWSTFLLLLVLSFELEERMYIFWLGSSTSWPVDVFCFFGTRAMDCVAALRSSFRVVLVCTACAKISLFSFFPMHIITLARVRVCLLPLPPSYIPLLIVLFLHPFLRTWPSFFWTLAPFPRFLYPLKSLTLLFFSTSPSSLCFNPPMHVFIMCSLQEKKRERKDKRVWIR